MTTVKAYYAKTENDDVVCVDVTVTTDAPLSGYGQPVVVCDGVAIPAQNFDRALFVTFDNRAGWDLVAQANKLSGFGESLTTAEKQAAFSDFFI